MKQKNLKIKILWLAIALSFFLMCAPAIILVNNSDFTILHIPAIYLYIFLLWNVLNLLTFIGWRLKWGDTDDT